MRKAATITLCLILGMAIGAGIFYLVLRSSKSLAVSTILTCKDTSTLKTVAASENETLMKTAYEVVYELKAKDFDKLATRVHPKDGVIFSPNATVNLTTDKHFSSSELAGLSDNTSTFIWGTADGSGQPIELTTADYWKRYVFDKDYTVAPQVGINSVIKTGNALENLDEVFKDLQFVEFHYPGTEQFGGNDWTTLRLGFKQYNGAWMLVAVVHSQWTS